MSETKIVNFVNRLVKVLGGAPLNEQQQRELNYRVVKIQMRRSGETPPQILMDENNAPFLAGLTKEITWVLYHWKRQPSSLETWLNAQESNFSPEELERKANAIIGLSFGYFTSPQSEVCKKLKQIVILLKVAAKKPQSTQEVSLTEGILNGCPWSQKDIDW